MSRKFVVAALFCVILLSPKLALYGQTCSPNREPWNWTVNTSQTLYLNGSSSGVFARQVLLPYYAFDGFATNLSDPMGPDVLPADGWVLVFRSFGTPTCGTNMPFFVLYNRYSGILRLFFYNDLPTQAFSFGQVTLQETNSANTSLLAFDGGDANHSLLTLSSVGLEQWSYADFKLVTFDPSPQSGATLQFAIDGVTTTHLNLTGGLSLNQVEETAQVAGTLSLTNGAKAISAAGTDYKRVADAAAALGAKADQPENKGVWWEHLAGQIANNGTVLGGIAGIAGFVESFLGGGKAQAVPMHFQGEIQATGTLDTVSQVYEFIVRVPGSPHSSTADLSLPIYDSKLGVFNATIPTIDSYFVVGDCGFEITCIFDNGRFYQSETPITIQLNPTLMTDATVTVSVGWTFFNGPPMWIDQQQATTAIVNIDASGQFTDNLSGIAVELTIQPNAAPVGQAPIVIMQTYGVNVEERGFR